MIYAATEYTRAYTAWSFFALGLFCFLIAYGLATARWMVGEYKKWKLRRSQQPISLSNYATRRKR